jgi:hypothetical protein
VSDIIFALEIAYAVPGFLLAVIDDVLDGHHKTWRERLSDSLLFILVWPWIMRTVYKQAQEEDETDDS